MPYEIVFSLPEHEWNATLGCTVRLMKSSESLNEVFSALSARRRYEVWFVRMGLANGSGAWWFRYLVMNPGRGGCPNNPQGMPVQVWATWFPCDGKPQTFIQGYPLQALNLSKRAQSPFHLRIADNEIGENFCRGALNIDGHTITWNLNYRSTFGVTLSNKGWIGFSRTPHSDASFSGHVTLDGRSFAGDPLGFGLQGHNCGYRHRNFWTWAHAYFLRPDAPPSTLEALVYDMPFGLVFRKVVLWHDGRQYLLRKLEEIRADAQNLRWHFRAGARDGLQLDVNIDGQGGCLHCLPYVKTDCSGSFDVLNNSLAAATVRLRRADGSVEQLETKTGAVLEIVGRR